MTTIAAPLRVVIAEDSVLIREGISRLIEESGGTVVAKVGDGDAFVEAVAAHRPDVSVVDDSWTSAEAYAAYMGRWSRLVAAELLARLDPPGGLRWLDVGCGTGVLTQAVLSAAAPGATIFVTWLPRR